MGLRLGPADQDATVPVPQGQSHLWLMGNLQVLAVRGLPTNPPASTRRLPPPAMLGRLLAGS